MGINFRGNGGSTTIVQGSIERNYLGRSCSGKQLPVALLTPYYSQIGVIKEYSIDPLARVSIWNALTNPIQSTICCLQHSSAIANNVSRSSREEHNISQFPTWSVLKHAPVLTAIDGFQQGP